MCFSKKYTLIVLCSFLCLNNSDLLYSIGKRPQIGCDADNFPMIHELSKPVTKQSSTVNTAKAVVKDLAVAYLVDRGLVLAHEMGHIGVASLCGKSVKSVNIGLSPLSGHGFTKFDFSLSCNEEPAKAFAIAIVGPAVGLFAAYQVSNFLYKQYAPGKVPFVVQMSIYRHYVDNAAQCYPNYYVNVGNNGACASDGMVVLTAFVSGAIDYINKQQQAIMSAQS